MIPPFNEHGVLSHDVEATVTQIEQSFLVTGAGLTVPGWDAAWRARLVYNLRVVAERFWLAGGTAELWIDGSFVEDKPRPNDIDAYYRLAPGCDPVSFRQRLNALEGEMIWSWAPRSWQPFPDSAVPRLPFWGKYRVDIFRESGEDCGITGPAGEGLTFAQAFRRQRYTLHPKGIIRLRNERSP